jgi:hypothetical protein
VAAAATTGAIVAVAAGSIAAAAARTRAAVTRPPLAAVTAPRFTAARCKPVDGLRPSANATAAAAGARDDKSKPPVGRRRLCYLNGYAHGTMATVRARTNRSSGTPTFR